MSTPTLLLGALGGPSTFGAQAAKLLQQARPEFTEIQYIATVEEVYGDVGFTTDANCVPDQMSQTGFHVPTQTRLLRETDPLYVAGEIEHAYGCRLLAKRGTRLEDVRHVLGHTGSIGQSRSWLEEHLPQATIELVHSHSLGAGQAVLDGDSSMACVGTADLENELDLAPLALDIDGGSVCNYFAISGRPLFADRPDRLVVTTSRGDGRDLAALVGALTSGGFHLASTFAASVGDRLFRYRYVTRWEGTGSLGDVQAAVDSVPGAQLRGAFAKATRS